MTLEKIATTNLDTNAYYQGIHQTNINFYVNDSNTSVLEFSVTRNQMPVPLSDVNVKSYIAILTPGGYQKIDNLQFYDELNGILRYTLPDDVLAQPGQHTAQVYISVNGVKDTVVEKKITFTIEDDLINQVSSDEKLSYIRIFDDLYSAIKQRVADIENSIKNASDYVAQIVNAKNSAYQDITNLVNQKKTEIENSITQYKQDVKKAIDDSKVEVEERANQYIQQIQNAKTEVTQSIANADLVSESKVRNMLSPYQTKEQANLSNSNLLQQANSYTDSLFEQGKNNTISVDGLDFNNLNITIKNTGVYYFTGAKNAPNSITEGVVRFVKKPTETGLTGYLELIPSDSNKFVYASWVNQNVITEWSRTFRTDANGEFYTKPEVDTLINNAKKDIGDNVVGNYQDTGWIDITLINGAVTYNETSVPKIKMLTVNGTRIISVKGAIKGITTKGTIGMIPSNISQYIDATRSFVQNTSIDNNATNFNRFALVSNGEIRLDATTLNPIKDTHWMPLDVTILL